MLEQKLAGYKTARRFRHRLVQIPQFYKKRNWDPEWKNDFPKATWEISVLKTLTRDLCFTPGYNPPDG